MAVTPPRQGVAVGSVEVAGKRIPVTVDPEYLRYFSLLGNAANGSFDHGSLSGLSDDDHPQYFNTARGDARYAQLAQKAFPVGAIYTSVTGVNPASELGYGTWVAFGVGRVLVGVDAGDPDFDTVMETGGSKAATISGGGGGGGSGASWTEIEVDFGPTPVYEAVFTITDAAITSSAVKIQVLPCGKAATGRTADDWQWDGATFAANPGTGSATCYAVFTSGPIVGRRRIQYSVGA